MRLKPYCTFTLSKKNKLVEHNTSRLNYSALRGYFKTNSSLVIKSDLYFVSVKDNDIMEANVSLGELQQKIKRLEGLCQVSSSNL